MELRLDRASPVPLYHQVARQLEDAMERGDIAAGSRLDNETDLAQRWGLSRPTVRRALAELVDKGLVVRRRGIGTQVLGTAKVRRQVQLTSLYDDLARSGQDPTTDLLRHEIAAADEVVAEQLGVEQGANVLRIERRRCARGRPLAVLRNWLPMEVAATFTREQLESTGLYALFRSTGVHTRIAAQRIGARGAEIEEAQHLDVEPGTAVLTMERTTYDDTGRAVELGRHSYRADHYSFEVVVVQR